MSFLITIYRGDTPLISIKPDSASNQKKTVMGENVVNIQFELNKIINFNIGDWCTVYGENYYLNRIPTIRKESTRLYKYTLVMQSEYFDLSKAQFLFYDENNELKQGVFSLMGNPDTFMDLLIKNANRVGAGWTKGTVIGGPYQNMTFNSESCLAVLARIAQQFGTEYFIQGKKVSLDKRQKDKGVTLRQGKDKGLYEIERKPFSDSNVVTRLYAFGSEKNLPSDYRNYAGRLRMTDGEIYIENNISKYGVVEQTKIFEEIFPHRTGKVTSANAGNPFVFSDSGMDFDVNDQLLPGVSAKVTFNTGQLQGYTFDIKEFDYSTKTFTILKNKDEKALEVPSSLFRPVIGDEYVLVDIFMPQTYVDAAEALLKTKAQQLLDEYSEPLVEFSVLVDPAYFRRKNLTVDIGDMLWVVDSNLEINKKIRVTSFTRSFEEEYDYELTLSDGVDVQPIQELYNSAGSNSREISDINNRLNNRASENNFVGEVIMSDVPAVTDTSGMFALFVDNTGKVFKKT